MILLLFILSNLTSLPILSLPFIYFVLFSPYLSKSEDAKGVYRSHVTNEERLSVATDISSSQSQTAEFEMGDRFSPMFSPTFSHSHLQPHLHSQFPSSAVTSKSASPATGSLENSDEEDNFVRRRRGNSSSSYILRKCLIVDGKYYHYYYNHYYYYCYYYCYHYCDYTYHCHHFDLKLYYVMQSF